MCSLDGRSGTNTGATPRERSKRAWKDQLEDERRSMRAVEAQPGDSLWKDSGFLNQVERAVEGNPSPIPWRMVEMGGRFWIRGGIVDR